MTTLVTAYRLVLCSGVSPLAVPPSSVQIISKSTIPVKGQSQTRRQFSVMLTNTNSNAKWIERLRNTNAVQKAGKSCTNPIHKKNMSYRSTTDNFPNMNGRRLKATLANRSRSTKSGSRVGSRSGSRTDAASGPRSARKTTSASNTSEASSWLFGRELEFFLRKVYKFNLNEFLLKPHTIPLPRWITPRHYSTTVTECLGHSSFVLVAVSYAVDDFLLLRCIAVAASTSMLFFTYYHPFGRILWLPFKWNCLFILLNSYRIGKVYLEAYQADQLPEELLQMRDNHFYLMDPKDFAQLVKIGSIETYKKGDVIVEQDEPNRFVRFVLQGRIHVERNNELTYLLEEGNFLSEVGLHTGILLTGPVESCCSIIAGTDDYEGDIVRVMKWDRTELVDLLVTNSGIRNSIKAILSWDIVRKLKAQRKLLASGIIKDPEKWTKTRYEQNNCRYKLMLKNFLLQDSTTPAGHLSEEQLARLKKYRTTHQIDDQLHFEALREYGWTPERFETDVFGYKKPGSIWNDVQWRIRNIISPFERTP